MADEKQTKCPTCKGTGECDGAPCDACDGTGKAPVEKSGGVIEAAAHAFPAAAHMIHVAEGLGISAGAAAVASHHGGKVLGKLRGLRDKGVPKPGRMYVMGNKQYRVAHTDGVGTLMHHVPTGHGPQGDSQFIKAKQWSAHIKSGKIAPVVTGTHKSQEGPGMSKVFAELNKAMGVATADATVEKSGKINAKPEADEAKAAAAGNPFVGPDACLWEDFTAGLQPGNALGDVTRTHSGGVVLKYPVLDGNGTIHINMDESTWKGLVHNIGQLGDKVKDPPMSGKTGIKKSEAEAEGEPLAKAQDDCPSCGKSVSFAVGEQPHEVTCPHCHAKAQAYGEKTENRIVGALKKLVGKSEGAITGPYEPLAGDRATDPYGRGYVVKSVENGAVVMGYAEDPSADDAMLAKSDVINMFSDPNLTIEREGRVVSVNGTEEYRDLAREYSRVRLHRRPGDPE